MILPKPTPVIFCLLGLILSSCDRKNLDYEEEEQFRISRLRLGQWQQLFHGGREGFWQGCNEALSVKPSQNLKDCIVEVASGKAKGSGLMPKEFPAILSRVDSAYYTDGFDTPFTIEKFNGAISIKSLGPNRLNDAGAADDFGFSVRLVDGGGLEVTYFP